jgi:pSer/pThr/pTyr-binding forkhead associated (FHA) protein
MSLKRWVLGKVQSGDMRGERVESEVREPMIGAVPDEEMRGGVIAHLGPYAPLISAIRDELEQFVETQLRLHLAIAERDRYVLASIDVDSQAHDGSAALLRRFIAEFKPEQIKRFLARDVIAGLRNASAIDLTQFGGLNDAAAGAVVRDDPYRALIAELQSGTSSAAPRAFAVTLRGRWVQGDAAAVDAGARRGREPGRDPGRERGHEAEGAQTPLAGRALAIDIQDGRGVRRFDIASVLPGRRYVVGKDDGCDVTVDGMYASRRHCEIWFDGNAWWVIDAGSTNGIRVETRSAVRRAAPASVEPLELTAGARLVLSENAQGEARLYPRLTMHPLQGSAGADAAGRAAQATPLAPARAKAGWRVTARMASGTRDIDIAGRSLPLSIGRSRSQSLVVDSAHAEVSGKHVEIVSIDDAGVDVRVLGDNGVSVDGTVHGPGTRFSWRPGETLVLGDAGEQAPACTLSLSRSDG